MINVLYGYPLYHWFHTFIGLKSGHQAGKETQEIAKLTGGPNPQLEFLIAECQEVFKKYCLSKVFIQGGPIIGAQGAALLPWNKTIYVDIRLCRTDPEAMKFVAKHEIAHIKNNDSLLEPLAISIFTCLTVRVIAKLPVRSWMALSLGFTAIFTFHQLVTQYQEKRADAFAVAHSNLEQLKGAIRLFQASLNANKLLAKNNRVYSFLIKENGEFSKWATGFFHLQTPQRIKDLSAIYKTQTGMEYKPAESELEKLNKILYSQLS